MNFFPLTLILSPRQRGEGMKDLPDEYWEVVEKVL